MNQLESFRNSSATHIFKAIKPKNFSKCTWDITQACLTGKNCKNSYGCEEGLAGF
jgi:hypothetical protein